MFELEVWQAPITDNQGNILPGAQITVFNSDDTVATIYDDLNRTPKANPFTVGTDALARFYAEPGRYRVQAQSGTDIAVYDNVDLSQKSVRNDLAAPDSEALIAGEMAKDVASLRGHLSAPLGSARIRNNTVTLSSIKELAGIPVGKLRTDLQYSASAFSIDSITSGGTLLWRPDMEKSRHNGRDILSQEAIVAWDGTEDDLATLEDWSGLGDGCFEFISRDHSYKNISETKPVVNVQNGGKLHKIEGQDFGVIQNQRIVGAGVDSSLPTYAIIAENESGSARNHKMDSLRISDFSGAAVKWTGGWNNTLSNSYITGCRFGFQSEISTSVSGWAFSGFLSENNYYSVGNAAGRVGLNLTGGWCFTSINDVIEYSNVPIRQNVNGRTDIFINTWLEANQNPPEFRRPTVTIGGRGWDYSDISTFSNDASVINIGHNGDFGVYSNEGTQFEVDGEGVKSFNPSRAGVGFNIQSAPDGGKELRIQPQGGIYSALGGLNSSPSVPVISMSGISNFYGNPEPAVAEGERAAVEIASFTQSGGNGRSGAIIRFKTIQASINGGIESSGYRWEIGPTGNLSPFVDDSVNLGSASARVREIFAVNGAINTSDSRLKTENKESELSLAVDAWGDVRSKAWKWLSAIEEKGASARLHIGPFAQDIIKAFENRGIDAFSYGLVCKDFLTENIEEETTVTRTKLVPYVVEEEITYIDKDGEEKTTTDKVTKQKEEEYQEVVKGFREVDKLDEFGDLEFVYSIRPTECLFLEMEYSRRRLDAIEDRLKASGV